MPAGTVIGDPNWWAAKLLNAAYVYLPGYSSQPPLSEPVSMDREPLDIIMRYKAERTNEAQAVAEIVRYARASKPPRAARCEACLGDGTIEYGHPNAPEPDRVETCKECNGTGNAQCPQCVEACEMLGRAGIADGDLIDKVGDAIEAMERAPQPQEVWRPISEKPPPCLVLVATSEGVVMAGDYAAGRWWEHGRPIEGTVTHWKPWPAAPAPTKESGL
jgi:hypothetical protein